MSVTNGSKNKNKLIDYSKMEHLNTKSSALGMTPTIPESPTVRKYKSNLKKLPAEPVKQHSKTQGLDAMVVAQISKTQQARESRDLSVASSQSGKKLLSSKHSKLKVQGSKSSTGDMKRRKSDGPHRMRIASIV